MATSPSQAGETVLRTYDLTKHYGSRVAVNHLNLEMKSTVEHPALLMSEIA